MGVISKTQILVSELQSLLDYPDAASRSPSLNSSVKWRPPLGTALKCNSDAAFDSSTGKGYAGVVIRNCYGKMEVASTGRICAISPLSPKALALRMALEFAISLGIQTVLFESDCLILVEACRGGPMNKEIRGILLDINNLRDQFQKCGFTWVARAGNTVAHNIVALALSGRLMGNWAINPPRDVQQDLTLDIQRM